MQRCVSVDGLITKTRVCSSGHSSGRRWIVLEVKRCSDSIYNWSCTTLRISNLSPVCIFCTLAPPVMVCLRFPIGPSTSACAQHRAQELRRHMSSNLPIPWLGWLLHLAGVRTEAREEWATNRIRQGIMQIKSETNRSNQEMNLSATLNQPETYPFSTSEYLHLAGDMDREPNSLLVNSIC